LHGKPDVDWKPSRHRRLRERIRAHAATVVGPVLASHYSVSCLRPAVGQRFVVRARVVKAGRTMVFTSAEVFAQADGKQTLVASGETILNVVAADGL
jgi:acyl-coenzyme A thioesterase PaaI-like protein